MKDYIEESFLTALSYGQLRAAVKDAWDAVPPEALITLLNEIPLGFQPVIDANGRNAGIRRARTFSEVPVYLSLEKNPEYTRQVIAHSDGRSCYPSGTRYRGFQDPPGPSHSPIVRR